MNKEGFVCVCVLYLLSLYIYPLKISMGIKEALYAFLAARFMKYFTGTDGFQDCQKAKKNGCKNERMGVNNGKAV